LQIALSKYVNADRNISDYLYILYQPRAIDQFWYLPALFNVSVIYILIKSKLKPPNWVQILIGLLLYFVSALPGISKFSMLSDWMEFYIFFALGDAIAQFFFKDSTQRFMKKSSSLLLILPFFVLTQLFYLSNDETYYRLELLGQVEFLIIAFVGCLSMFILAFQFQKWNILSFLRVLGYHSLFIYIMHLLVIAFVRIILTKVFHIHSIAILLPCGIIFGVTIPIIIYNLLIKDKFLGFLFSYRKNQTTTQGS
jgi:surface polysaccharide O-acyltransferase-like enzyme